MTSTLKLFFKCFYTPSLYMTYRSFGKYIPDRWEKLGDFSLSTVVFFWKLGLYTSPLIAIIVYRRGYLTMDSAFYLTRMSLWLGVFLGATFCIRSYGRMRNPQYRMFLSKFDNIDTPNGVADIKTYDFDFQSWPVEFYLPIRTSRRADRKERTSLWSPCSLVGYLVLHTAGIRMIYPGSISLLNKLFAPLLVDGRRVLVERKNGERYKLQTPDNNYIDSIFVDRRTNASTSRSRGQYLVICSEGNAGFYENGIVPIPVEAGFSVLGWNHPGFGASTGMPYIEQEEAAIETVVEFAIQRLGFTPEQIIMYGWSIGGYASSWAAATYPGIKAVVGDATFDDLLPLALNQMPTFLHSVVRLTIRSFADLNVAKVIMDYGGPLKLIRRTDDEIISISPGDVSTNRGNDLLKKVLKRRYPQVISDEPLDLWLFTTGHQQRRVCEEYGVNKEECAEEVERYVREHGDSFPLSGLGRDLDQPARDRLTLYLAGQYMVDYAATHCTLLPSTVFVNLLEDLL